MIIKTPEGFKIQESREGSKQFMIDSSRLDECIAYIKLHDLRHIGINSFIGYTISNLDFLLELRDFVEGITVPENHFDISVLNQLHRLVILGFADNKKDTIDLSNFPNLADLACEYSPRLVSLETCEELRHLTLTKYRSDKDDLISLPILTSLEELNLYVTNIASLDGIQRFRNLTSLTVFRAKRLTRIDCLSSIKDSIREIEFEGCKRISSYEVLAELQNLERLIITGSNEIENLDFVRSLANLKFISFVDTNVKSGDLSPCFGVKYVGFDDRKHYNHKFGDFSNPSSRDD